MAVEERGDATPGVEGGRLVVGDVGEAKDLEEDVLVVVHERMSGVRIFFYVMGDRGAFERPLKLLGDALVPAVLRAVTGDDGAGSSKEAIDVGGELPP